MAKINHQTAQANAATWQYPQVPVTEYRSDASADITKQVLVGKADGAKDFIVRYFTVPPGGKTAYDQHPHQHGVVVVQGKGRVMLNDAWHELNTGDSVFTDSNEIHQFEAVGNEPLGFICVIPTWAEL